MLPKNTTAAERAELGAIYREFEAVSEKFRKSATILRGLRVMWGTADMERGPWQNVPVALPLRTEAVPHVRWLKNRITEECTRVMEIARRFEAPVPEEIWPYIIIQITRETMALYDNREEHLQGLRTNYAGAAQGDAPGEAAVNFVNDVRKAWKMSGQNLKVGKFQDHVFDFPETAAEEGRATRVKVASRCAELLELCHRLDVPIDDDFRPHVLNAVADLYLVPIRQDRAFAKYHDDKAIAALPRDPARADEFVEGVRAVWGERQFNNEKWEHPPYEVPGLSDLPYLDNVRRKILGKCNVFMEICHRLGVIMDKELQDAVLMKIAHEKLSVQIQKFTKQQEEQKTERESRIVTTTVTRENARDFVDGIYHEFEMSGLSLRGKSWQKHDVWLPKIGALPPVRGLPARIEKELTRFMEMCHRMDITIPDEESRKHVFVIIARDMSAHARQVMEEANEARRQASLGNKIRATYLAQQNTDPKPDELVPG
jgi:hypothetical protein